MAKSLQYQLIYNPMSIPQIILILEKYMISAAWGFVGSFEEVIVVPDIPWLDGGKNKVRSKAFRKSLSEQY